MTLYNPHLLARQDLIDTFVARQPLLDELIDDLRRGGGGHHLLVGGRGSGKTTLLLRLAAALEDDKRLAKKSIPLRFPEEQYNVSRPSDFWMNAIDALVDALERQGDHLTAKRLESSLLELEPLEESERAKQSLAILEGWARQARRLIVLLIDNLDLVLDRLSASLWELREALSIDNRLVVVGASSKFIEEAIDYQSPFYDFFHVHELGPLSEEEARRLVLSLARRANTPRVGEVLDRDPGRFKALYVLTGGTPRTLALLHTVLALEHSDRIERDLDGLLDQLTPYYKARFDDLPAQSQVVVDKVALHWHPITAAECQAATHLDLNVVSAQLSRLVKSGLLAKVSLPGPSKLGFQLSERFFNIWYLMRASRRLRRRLSWFVEFLRMFYGEEDLRRRAEELVRTAPPDSLNSPATLLAFASAVPDQALRRRLEFRAVALLVSEDVRSMRELMDLEGEDRHLAPIVDRVRALRDIRARIASSKHPWPPGVTPESVADRIARDPEMPLRYKQRIATAMARGKSIYIREHIDLAHQETEFGKRLLDAVASGELPSLPDVTPDEIRQVIESSSARDMVIINMFLSTEYLGTPLTDPALEDLLRLSQRTADVFMAGAIVFIHGGKWPRARQLVLQVVRHSSPLPELGAFISFFSGCVAADLVGEAIDLLVEAGLAERWAPLYEALRAIAAGDKARLGGLAPEMRLAAAELYEQLCAPEGSPAERDSHDLVTGLGLPKRKPAATKRAASARLSSSTVGRREPSKRRRLPASGRN